MDKNWCDNEAAYISPDGQIKLVCAKFFDKKLLKCLDDALPTPPEGSAPMKQSGETATPMAVAAKVKREKVRAKAKAANLQKQTLACLKTKVT